MMRDLDPTRIPPVKRGTYWHGHALRPPADAVTRRYQYLAMQLFAAHDYRMAALSEAVGLDERTLGRCINGGTTSGKRLSLDATTRAKLDAAFRRTCPDDPAWADGPPADPPRVAPAVTAAREAAPVAPRGVAVGTVGTGETPALDALRAAIRAEIEQEYRQRFAVEQVFLDGDEPTEAETVVDPSGAERAWCRNCSQYKRVYASGPEALEHDGVLRSVLGDGSTRVPSVCYRCKRGFDARIARWHAKTEAWLDERIAFAIEAHLAEARAHDAHHARDALRATVADLVERRIFAAVEALTTEILAVEPDAHA